jgi:transposase
MLVGLAVTTGRFVRYPRGFLSPSLHRQHIETLRHHRIDAPCVLDGPINSESSKGYIEHFLVPTLKPGDIVIMDNLGSHKGRAVRHSLRGREASLPAALQF